METTFAGHSVHYNTNVVLYALGINHKEVADTFFHHLLAHILFLQPAHILIAGIKIFISNGVTVAETCAFEAFIGS